MRTRIMIEAVTLTGVTVEREAEGSSTAETFAEILRRTVLEFLPGAPAPSPTADPWPIHEYGDYRDRDRAADTEPQATHPDLVAPNDDIDLYSTANLERGYRVDVTPKTPNQIAHQILATDKFDRASVPTEVTDAILAWWRGGPDPVAQVARLVARDVGEDRPFLLAALYAVEATVGRLQTAGFWLNPWAWNFTRDEFGDPRVSDLAAARLVANTPTMLSALAGMQRQSDPATDAQLGEAILPRMEKIRDHVLAYATDARKNEVIFQAGPTEESAP